MILPMVMKEAEAYASALKAFAYGQPIGDGAGPLIAAKLMHGYETRKLPKDCVMATVPFAGRTAIIIKAEGPGGNVGKPGDAVEAAIEENEGKIATLIMIDAGLKLEGEDVGEVAEGIGAAIGGPGVDQYKIEEKLTKYKIPNYAIIIKEDIGDAVSPMRKEINDAVDKAIERIRSRSAGENQGRRQNHNRRCRQLHRSRTVRRIKQWRQNDQTSASTKKISNYITMIVVVVIALAAVALILAASLYYTGTTATGSTQSGDYAAAGVLAVIGVIALSMSSFTLFQSRKQVAEMKIDITQSNDNHRMQQHRMRRQNNAGIPTRRLRLQRTRHTMPKMLRQTNDNRNLQRSQRQRKEIRRLNHLSFFAFSFCKTNRIFFFI